MLLRASRSVSLFCIVLSALGCAASDGRNITYRLAEPGQVSAAIYDAEGKLVRELRRGEKQSAGAHTLYWDGLNRAGEPMPPGEYEWRVLRTPGLQAEYITSLGTNPGSARWHTWVGNHGGASSVAIDETGMYIAAASTETAPVLLKQSLDGTLRHWTRERSDLVKGAYQGGLSVASDGAGTLYMLQQDGFLNVIDAANGELRDRWDVLPEDKQRAQDGGPTHRIYTHSRKSVADTDMDARGETIVISYRQRDEVWWINAENGSIETGVDVPSPRGVAVTPKGEVLVISEGGVLAVTSDGQRRIVIEDNIPHAHRLTVDAPSGHVLVAEEAPSHQVMRFTMAGELLATYGRKGGRRNGAYEPLDLLAMTDIAADGSGGFIIVEERFAPRRVAHFDADGELVNEWYGGQRYYTWAEPDPRDPSKVWFNSWQGLVLAEVDYDTGEWRVLESYELGRLAGGLVRYVHGSTGRWRVLYHDDRRYLVSEWLPQVLRHRAGSLTPVSVTSWDRGGTHPTLPRAKEIAGIEDENVQAFRWVDGDGNGVPQANEFTFTDTLQVPRATWITDDFALLTADNAKGENDQPLFELRRTVPTWLDGVTVYPFGDDTGIEQRVVETTLPMAIGGLGWGVYRSAAGDYYAHYLSRREKHGTSWPTYAGNVARLVKWDDAGEVQWKVGRHAIHGGLGVRVPGATPPGQLHQPVGIIGEAHGNVILADRVETPAMAWTPDGLYAGSLFDRRIDDGLPEVVYSWWRDAQGNEAITTSDNASAGRVFQTDDGTVLWFAQGRNNSPVYRIHGWEGWQRESGTITLDDTLPHAQAEGKGLHAAYYKGSELTGEPDAERIDTQVWHGIPEGEPDSGKKWRRHILSGWHVQEPAYDWSSGIEPLGVDTNFAVRWTGEIEAPLNEAFTFSVYTRGAVRLWIDGQQRIFAWNPMRDRWESKAIELRAGERYTVQLDYHSTHEHPLSSLNWESFSIDRQRIPQRYLYPADIEIIDTPDVRPATAHINAGTFDTQSGDITPQFATQRLTDRIWGSRQRGFGKSGAYIGFQRIDFGAGVSRLYVRAGALPAGNAEFEVTLEFRLDSPDGLTVATLALHDDKEGNWRQMPQRAVSVSRDVTGGHDLYIVNTTVERSHTVLLHSFRFE